MTVQNTDAAANTAADGGTSRSTTTWWGGQAAPTSQVGSAGGQPPHEVAVDHLLEVIRQADLEANKRLGRAGDQARHLVQTARDEAAAILTHAQQSADTILSTARSTADRELAEARLEAQQVLRRATEQLRATLAAAAKHALQTGEAATATPQRQQRLAALVLENAELAARLRSVNVELSTFHTDGDDPAALEGAAPVVGRAPVVPVATVTATVPAPVSLRRDARAAPIGHGTGPLPAKAAKAAERPGSVVPQRSDALAGRRGVWGRLMYRYRTLVLVLAAVLAVGAGIWGPAVVSTLSSGGFDVPGSESDLTATQIARTVGRQGIDVVALYRSPTLSVDTPQFKAAVDKVVAGLPRDGVDSVATFWTTNSPAFVSKDRKATYLALRLTGTESQRQDRFVALRDSLDVDPAVATTQLGGVSAIDVQISDQVSKDLTFAETLSAPLLTILLVIVFGSLVAAGLPLLVGGLTVITSFLILRLLTQITDISIFAVNIVTVLGLGLSIDYALLIVSRFREEQRAGHDTSSALARTMTTAGRSVAISATTVAVSLCGLLFFPMVFLRSMAYGGVAAVAVAAIGSLTILPAVIGVLGHRVNALHIPVEKLRRRRPTGPDETAAAVSDGAWARLARSVMRRPVLYTLGVSVVLLTMALPTFTVRFGGIDARQLPVGAESRTVNDVLANEFTGIQLNPVDVLVRGGGQPAAAGLSRQISALKNVSSVRVGAQKGQDTLLAVDYAGEAIDAKARTIVTQIRALTPPTGSTVLVGGYSAQQVDLRDKVVQGLWKMGALTFAVTFLLLFWAFGSFVLPIKAIFMNILAVGASLGVVVLVFQDGYLSGLLRFSSTGNVELTQPILVLAILFGVSTDYEVFLLSRIREHWDRTRDNTASVAMGLQQTGPIITSAAALILVVIVAFSTSQIIFIKLIGVGMAVAILLDSTVVRALLVPATMRLLGRWNWWAPGPLLRLWERHRPASESLEPVPAAVSGPAAVRAAGAGDGEQTAPPAVLETAATR